MKQSTLRIAAAVSVVSVCGLLALGGYFWFSGRCSALSKNGEGAAKPINGFNGKDSAGNSPQNGKKPLLIPEVEENIFEPSKIKNTINVIKAQINSEGIFLFLYFLLLAPPFDASLLVKFYVYGFQNPYIEDATFEDILNWENEKLASCRKSMHWLFPLPPTGTQPPKHVSLEAIDENYLLKNSICHENMRLAVQRMQTLAKAHKDWIKNPENYNNERWTHIIASLCKFGLYDDALAFFRFLVEQLSGEKNTPRINDWVALINGLGNQLGRPAVAA